MRKFFLPYLPSIILFVGILSLNAMETPEYSFCPVKSIFDQGCNFLAYRLSAQDLCEQFSFWESLRPEFAFMLLSKRIEVAPVAEIYATDALLLDEPLPQFLKTGSTVASLKKNLHKGPITLEQRCELFNYLYALALEYYEQNNPEVAHTIVLTLQQENIFLEELLEKEKFKSNVINKREKAHAALLQEVQARKDQWKKFEQWIADGEKTLILPDPWNDDAQTRKAAHAQQFADLNFSLEALLNDPSGRGALNRCIDSTIRIDTALMLLANILECPNYTSSPENLAKLINQAHKRNPSFFYTLLSLYCGSFIYDFERELFKQLPEYGITIFELLLRKGADLTLRNSNGDTVLHGLAYRADRFKKQEIAEKMIFPWLERNLDPQEYTAFINCPNNRGRSPLYESVCYSNVSFAEFLLNHKVLVGGPHDKGETPLYKALTYEYLPLAELLVREGAWDRQSLILACNRSYRLLLKNILTKHVGEIPQKTLNLALYTVVARKNARFIDDMVSDLLKAGAVPDEKTLATAQKHGHTNAATLMEETIKNIQL
jgi:hypothetical protein